MMSHWRAESVGRASQRVALQHGVSCLQALGAALGLRQWHVNGGSRLQAWPGLYTLWHHPPCHPSHLPARGPCPGGLQKLLGEMAESLPQWPHWKEWTPLPADRSISVGLLWEWETFYEVTEIWGFWLQELILPQLRSPV